MAAAVCIPPVDKGSFFLIAWASFAVLPFSDGSHSVWGEMGSQSSHLYPPMARDVEHWSIYWFV